MRLAIVCALLASGTGFAEDGKWETVVNGPPITVKTRARDGSNIKEIWAEGELDAPLPAVQEVLVDPESFPKYMPYVKESRILGKPEADGSVFVYIKLNPPVVAARDYINHVTLDESPKPDGSGQFRQHWVTVPDRTPERRDTVRLRTNDGSWMITPKSDAKCYAVYKFTTDPGGSIPAFVADIGNKSGVTDVFKAIEKEAKRRASEKKSGATAAKP